MNKMTFVTKKSDKYQFSMEGRIKGLISIEIPYVERL